MLRQDPIALGHFRKWFPDLQIELRAETSLKSYC